MKATELQSFSADGCCHAEGNGEFADRPSGGRQPGRGLGESARLHLWRSVSTRTLQRVPKSSFIQPLIRCRPRNLFRSPSMPSPASRPAVKRPDCPVDENTPVRVKRRRSLAGTQVTLLEQDPESPRSVRVPGEGVNRLHNSS